MTRLRTPYARRRFGQHFLRDASIVDRIVAAVAPDRDTPLVEIGPGRGALTAPLLERVGSLDVIEIDRDLARRLNEQFSHLGELRVHQRDALRTDICGLADRPVKVVGNLPYNISTPLMFHLIAQSHCIVAMVLMLQKEVVERICAAPATPEYGRLSVMVQAACRVQLLFGVPASAFSPPPRVESAVLSLVPELPARASDQSLFSRLVRCAFNQRRKMLRNSLGGMVEPEVLDELGIAPEARAGDLSVADYLRIAERQAAGTLE